MSDSIAQSVSDPFFAGVAVTSHDVNQLVTATFEGLSILGGNQTPEEIGSPGLIGNAAIDLTVEGAGSDIWGTADSFEFVDDGALSALNGFGWNVNIRATHPFAKAGLMYRESRDAAAPTVILDVTPDGAIEFMARLCTGCPMTFLKSAQVGLPAWLTLVRNGATISGQARTADQSQSFDVGSVEVPMTSPLSGVAVTSHDPSQIAIGTFVDPTIK